MRSALTRGEPGIHHFRLQVRREHSPRWVENHIEVVRDAAGKPERIRGVMMDITSPLTAIGTAAQILKATLPEHSQSSYCVDMIRRQATHLGRLVEDLLDVGRAIRDRLEDQ